MVEEKIQNKLKQIIFKYLDPEKYKIFIFGSRATEENREHSDIDLGILGEKPVDWATLARIEDDIEQSDIPYLVDVVDFHSVSERFKKMALTKIIDIK